MPPVIIGLTIALLAGPIGIGVFASIAVTNALIGIGLSMAFEGVVQQFSKHPSANASLAVTTNLGSSTVSVRQAISARVTQYGQDRRGGIFTFLHLSGANNELLHLVITMSGHQVQSIDNMYFDGVLVNLDGSGNGLGKYAGFVHVEKKLGGPGEAAFAGLVAAAPTKWTSNHRQDGCASVYVQLKWSADIFPSGIPNITFDMHGKQVFDPRTGLTAYSENAALCLRDYLTATKPNANALTAPLGLGDLGANIDSAAAIAAANTCDETVLRKDSTTEPRYNCNGSLSTSDLPRDVIPGLLSAMAGNCVYAEGVWKIYAAGYRGTSLAFTDSDARDSLKFTPLITRRDLANGVKGTYKGPVTAWQPDDFPPVTNAAAVALDGETIWQDLALPFTTSPATAQRIAKIQLNRIRMQGILTFPGKFSLYQAEVCDVVQVTRSRFNWTAKLFETTSSQLVVVQDDQNEPIIGCDLVMRETDPSVYSWNPSTDETTVLASPPVTNLPDPTSVAACSTLAISESPVGVPTVGGASVLRVLAAFTPPADQYVLDGGHIWIERRDHADMIWRFAGKVAGAETQFFDYNIFTGHTYDYRVKAEGAMGGVFSSYLEVDNLTIGGNQIILMSAAHAQQGSMRPLAVPVWTLVTNTNNGSGVCTQRYTCPATTIPLSDGTSFTWPATDVTWTSLAAVTTYLRAPRYKIADGTVHWATGTGVNTDADPNTTPLTSGATQDQKNQMAINQYFDGYCPGSSGFLTATTPNNAGTGGGSGGGTGICIWEEELVIIAGVITRLGDATVGDLVKGRFLDTGAEVYRRIAGLSREYCADWYLVNGHRMTPCEQVNIEGQWMRAFEAPGAVQLFGVPGYKINIRLDAAAYDDQNFVLVAPDGTETIVHNFISSS